MGKGQAVRLGSVVTALVTQLEGLVLEGRFGQAGTAGRVQAEALLSASALTLQRPPRCQD